MQPPYAPNVVNQTVDYGGFTWKGNPGQGWTKQSATGGAPVSTGDPITDAINLSNYEQKQQIAANQPAIATLQGQQTNLGKAYADLLGSVMSTGAQAGSFATGQATAELAARGINPNSGYGQGAITQAIAPVNAQYGQIAANVGLGSAQDINQLASAIAALQTGNLPAAQTFGGNLGNMESGYLGQQYTVNAGLQASQLQAAKPFEVGNVVFNPSTKGYIYPTGQ